MGDFFCCLSIAKRNDTFKRKAHFCGPRLELTQKSPSRKYAPLAIDLPALQ
jgi:hypothetical protein